MFCQFFLVNFEVVSSGEEVVEKTWKNWKADISSFKTCFPNNRFTILPSQSYMSLNFGIFKANRSDHFILLRKCTLKRDIDRAIKFTFRFALIFNYNNCGFIQKNDTLKLYQSLYTLWKILFTCRQRWYVMRIHVPVASIWKSRMIGQASPNSW